MKAFNVNRLSAAIAAVSLAAAVHAGETSFQSSAHADLQSEQRLSVDGRIIRADASGASATAVSATGDAGSKRDHAETSAEPASARTSAEADARGSSSANLETDHSAVRAVTRDSVSHAREEVREALDVAESTGRAVLESTRTTVEQAVDSEVAAEARAAASQTVEAAVSDQVGEAVDAEVGETVSAAVESEVAGEVNELVSAEVADEVRETARAEAESAVKDVVDTEVRNEVSSVVEATAGL